MQVKATLIVLVCLSAILSGCSGKSTTSTTLDPGAKPVLAQGKGAINGLLIDDIYRPIPDALILLQGAGLTTTTDAEGQFSFLDVEPGSYVALASSPNHEASPINVDVRAGEYTDLEIPARRVFSSGGSTITTQYSVFIPCSTTTPVLTSTYACLGDTSGDSYRPGLKNLNFTGTPDLTYLVAEIKVNTKDNFEFVLRHDDGSSLGAEEWGSTRTNGTDYAKVVLQHNATYQTWQSGNENWTNDPERPMAALLFYLGTGGDEASGAACTVPSPGCLHYFGAGQKFAVKANIILTAFIGEPTVSIAEYHVMGPSEE